jgi:hypothetical protein
MTNEEAKRQFQAIFGEAGEQVLQRIEGYSLRLVGHIYDYIAGNLYQE